jgi:hypothetical protein
MGTVTKVVLVDIVGFVVYIEGFHYFRIHARLHQRVPLTKP